MDFLALATLVASVPDQAAVFAADLERARRAESVEKAAEDLAIDGVAWHVFNTLRGAGDDVNGATFDDVRSVVAREKF